MWVKSNWVCLNCLVFVFTGFLILIMAVVNFSFLQFRFPQSNIHRNFYHIRDQESIPSESTLLKAFEKSFHVHCGKFPTCFRCKFETQHFPGDLSSTPKRSFAFLSQIKSVLWGLGQFVGALRNCKFSEYGCTNNLTGRSELQSCFLQVLRLLLDIMTYLKI